MFYVVVGWFFASRIATNGSDPKKLAITIIVLFWPVLLFFGILSLICRKGD
jgi:hypothetical protein